MLGLSGALAAACFVKAFAITFLALPRGAKSSLVHEAPRSMLVGMGCLTVACLSLGLGATWFLHVFDALTEQLLGQRVGTNLITGSGLVLSAGVRHGGTVSTAVIGIGLLVLLIPAVLLVSIGTKRIASRRGPAWACRFPRPTEPNALTPPPLSYALRLVFSHFYPPLPHLPSLSLFPPYFPK